MIFVDGSSEGKALNGEPEGSLFAPRGKKTGPPKMGPGDFFLILGESFGPETKMAKMIQA